MHVHVHCICLLAKLNCIIITNIIYARFGGKSRFKQCFISFFNKEFSTAKPKAISKQ